MALLTALAGLAAAAGQELTSKELVDARKIYVAKCAKCHRFYDPKGYTEADWQKWMESMARKSKLKTAEGELLSRYLDLYRANKLPGKPQNPIKK